MPIEDEEKTNEEEEAEEKTKKEESKRKKGQNVGRDLTRERMVLEKEMFTNSPGIT